MAHKTSAKYPSINDPIPNLNNLFGSGYVDVDGYSYPVVITKPPGTPTITVVSTTDASWTPVLTNQTGIYLWRASERTGAEFRFAYVAAPGNNYATAWGILQRATNLANFYVQRIGADATIEIEVWKV